MKRIYFLLCTALIMAVIGCTKDPLVEPEPGTPSDPTEDPTGPTEEPVGPVTITATIEAGAVDESTEDSPEDLTSKVLILIDEESEAIVNYSWEEGDKIAVQTKSGFAEFALASGAGTAEAKFNGEAGTVNGSFAVYPAAAAGSVTNGVLTLDLPSSYNYAEGKLNTVMSAAIGADNTVVMNHLTGVVCVGISSVPKDAKLVFTAAGSKICGSCVVEEGQVKVTPSDAPADNAITVNFAEAVEKAIVFIPIPVGDYASWAAKVVSVEGEVLKEVSINSANIARKSLKPMPYITLTSSEYFVTPTGAGTKDGSSWDNAMGTTELRSLVAQPLNQSGAQDNEEAYNNAAMLDGATINMAAGDYYIGELTESSVKIEFTNYGDQVSMTFLGGYPDNLTGTSKEGRDTTTLRTAFTGNEQTGIFVLGNQTDITFDGITFKDVNLDDDGGAILAAAGESGNCTLTLNSCRFIDNKNVDGKTGAGIYLKKASATITNSYFAGNYARNGSALTTNSEAGTLTLTGCLFERNSTFNTSGAVQNQGKKATISNCTFKNNTANSWGGGAYHTGGNAENTFEDCLFEANKAVQGGGAVSIEVATCEFKACTFKGNVAENGTKDDAAQKVAGGAIIIRKPESRCTLNACTFIDNSAPNGSAGAIAVTETEAKLVINEGTIFTNNTSYHAGGAIYTKGDITINGTSSSRVVFEDNKTLHLESGKSNGGALYIESGTTNSVVHTLFDNNEAGQESSTKVNYSNGGAITLRAVASFVAENCEFTANRARNGGCFNLEISADSKCKFTNCNFHHNICLSGPNKDGNGANKGNFNGAVGRIGGGTVELENCMFADNKTSSASAVLHMNGENAVAKFTDCQILRNSSVGNNVCIKLEKTGQRLYMDRCLFEGNNGPSRGMIAPSSGSTVYLNDVTFKENYTTNSGNSWGICIHSGNSNVCMNNVTSYGNYNTQATAANSAIAFNSDGGWLIVNSTIIDKTPRLVRANGSRKVTLCNNIMLNTFAPDQIFILKSAEILNDKGHNLMSYTTTTSEATLNETDLIGQSETTLAGKYKAQWNTKPYYGVYEWTNALQGFTPATASEIHAAMASHAETDDKISIMEENIGLNFYSWLVSIGAIDANVDSMTFYDGRGVVRTGTMWPGAYQAN